MRWILLLLILLPAPVAIAAEGKVIKVLPLYLDQKGRDSLLPSLYERDAYQAVLRIHPDQRKALRFAVQCKAHKVDWTKTRIVVETRGVEGNTFITKKTERSLPKKTWFSQWQNIDISGK